MWGRGAWASSIAPTMGVASRFSHWLGFASMPPPVPDEPVAKAAPTAELAPGYLPVSEEPLHGQRAAPAATEASAIAKAEASSGASPTERIGVPGYSYIGGYLGSTEKNSDMVGASRWKNFDEWKKNVIPVGIGVRAYLTLAGLPSWKVQPFKADDAQEATPEDLERASWLQKQIGSMETQWADAVMSAAMSTLDGVSLQAWTFKLLADGRFGLDDLMKLPPHTIERWNHDENGRVIGVVQRAPNDGAEIPIERERMVWTRDIPITDHPEGVGVMRQLAEAVRQMQELVKYQNKAFEKDVNGIPVVYAPLLEKLTLLKKAQSGYTQADFDKEFEAPKKFVDANVRKGAGLMLDSSTYSSTDQSPSPVRRWHAEVLQAISSSFDALERRIDRLAWQLLALLGFEYLLLGQDGAGSLAMHSSKMAGALRTVTSVLNRIAETMRRDLVMQLWKWNGWDPETAPTLTWAAIELQDISSVAASIGDLLQKTGADPARCEEIVNFILEHFGAPPMKAYDDADLVIRREEERQAAADAAGLGDEDEPDEEE